MPKFVTHPSKPYVELPAAAAARKIKRSKYCNVEKNCLRSPVIEDPQVIDNEVYDIQSLTTMTMTTTIKSMIFSLFSLFYDIMSLLRYSVSFDDVLIQSRICGGTF